MGPRTDELEKVKEQLDEAQDELRQGAWQRRAKAIAIVITAVAGLVTGILANLRPETVAQETAGAAAAEISKLQAAIKAQDKAIEAAQAACVASGRRAAFRAKAEADSVRTLLLGYLLAAQKGPAGKPLKEALGKVVSQLGEQKAVALKPALPAPPPRRNFKPPRQLQQLSKGK